MAKNYYAILGVLPTATFEEIRSAYRNRAKQYHPDRYGKNSAPFLKVQEAYDVLGDPTTRNSYDHSLKIPGFGAISTDQPIPIVIRPGRSTVEPIIDPRRSSNLGMIFPRTSFNSYSPSFDEIFDDLWNVREHLHAPKFERFRTITMEVLLTQDQASRGGHVQVEIPIRHPCSVCNGYGDLGSIQCLGCDGSGMIIKSFSLQVEYPQGIRDYHEMAIPLDHYGIPDVCPVLRFRISGEGDFEDFF